MNDKMKKTVIAAISAIAVAIAGFLGINLVGNKNDDVKSSSKTTSSYLYISTTESNKTDDETKASEYEDEKTTKKPVVTTTTIKSAAAATKKPVVATTTVKSAATTTKNPVVTTTTVKSTAATTKKPITTEKTYVEYHFRTKNQLQQHFSKHGSEFKNDFGYKTAEEYEKGASDVINNPDALYKTEKEDGDGVYYLKNTNEFVILSTDGYIRTYFRPSSGMSYYERQ